MSANSRGVFATPGSRSFLKTPISKSQRQETPKSGGNSCFNVSIDEESACCLKDETNITKKPDFERRCEQKSRKTPKSDCNIYKRSLLNSSGYESKRRSVIYTGPDAEEIDTEGDKMHNSTLDQNLPPINSDQSMSGL